MEQLEALSPETSRGAWSNQEGDAVVTPFPRAATRNELILNLTRSINNALIAEGHTLDPVQGKPFVDACFDTLNGFSDKTLGLIAEYGVFTDSAFDADWEYECLSLLVSSQATEAQWRITMGMMPWLIRELKMTDPVYDGFHLPPLEPI